MVKTVVHLVRHGEVHNPQGLLYGTQPGFRLSKAGEAMAGESASYLADFGADVRAIYTSPLLRARQTASFFVKEFLLKATIREALIEPDNVLEMQPVHENRLLLAHPKFWRHYTNPLRPSWGEAYTSIVRRMLPVISEARAEAEGGDAVLVSHQLPIWAVVLFLQGKRLPHDPRSRQCALASITSLEFHRKKLVRIEYAANPKFEGAASPEQSGSWEPGEQSGSGEPGEQSGSWEPGEQSGSGEEPHESGDLD